MTLTACLAVIFISNAAICVSCIAWRRKQRHAGDGGAP